MMKRGPDMCCARRGELKEARGTKCYMHGYREKEKGGWRESAASRAVSGMLKEDKVAARRRSPSPRPDCRLHILSPAGAAAWLCPTKAGVTHGVYSMLLHASAYMCNCVWKFSLSHTLCVSIPTPSLSPLFSLFYSLFIYIYIFDSDSREWSKERQSFLNRSTFWVQTEIWQLRLSQFFCLLIHQMSRSAGNTWEIGRICSNFLQIEFDYRSGSFDSAPVFNFWTFELTVP